MNIAFATTPTVAALAHALERVCSPVVVVPNRPRRRLLRPRARARRPGEVLAQRLLAVATVKP